MSRRSHKPNKHSQDKIARAQHRNNFLRLIEQICILVAGKDVYKLIPSDILEAIYNARLQSLRIVTANGEPVSNATVKHALSLIPTILKLHKTPITANGIEFTLHDYYTAVLTFFIFVQGLDEALFAKAPEFKNRLKDFSSYEEGLDKANFQITGLIGTFANMVSDLTKQMFWLSHTIEQATEINTASQNLVEIHTVFPEHTHIIIDEVNRPVTRVGWCFPNFGLEKMILKPSDIGIEGTFSSIPLEVYIQSHALLRLRERLDNVLIGFVHLSLFISLKFPKAIRDKKGNILIEYRFMDTKAGYLRADIINGVILIRTFLFITNNGTPEGEKLEEIYGLGKLDKKYLAIDKLSAFMSSDIGSNNEINQIFKNVGCEGLLLLYTKFKPMLTKETEQSTADLLSKYLGLDKVQTFQ